MKFRPRLYKTITSEWAYRLARWGMGVIFLYASTVKLIEPRSFAILIDAFGLVPERLLMPLAIGLPAFEVAAAIGLLFDARGALAAISGLLILFLAVLGYGIWLGLDVDCGCFGPGDPEAKAFGGLHTAFYRDIILVGGVLYLYWWRLRCSFVPARFGILNSRL